MLLCAAAAATAAGASCYCCWSKLLLLWAAASMLLCAAEQQQAAAVAVVVNIPRRAVSSRGRGHSQHFSMNEIDEAVQVQEEILEHTLQALGGQVNASSSSSVRTRGPNLGHPIPSNPSDRQLIRLKGTVFLDSTVTRSITNDIKMRYTAPWKTWSEIPLKTKDELFELFRSRYAWDESEEGMVQIAWEKVGKERLRDILNRVRSELLCKHKKTDVAY
ncbi:hypothetical protein MANES_17G004315v8 [Manihot esculenta]|uniref:Uncharacterized protein n=1 Tax=Manihot esculenta TaxID=3983 RepID=A0ACB7G239_MANES|nr:hypothetical protein MANES_17G004315v8 [Manihot esculenta]